MFLLCKNVSINQFFAVITKHEWVNELMCICALAAHDQTTPTPLPPSSHGRKNTMRAIMSNIVARVHG